MHAHPTQAQVPALPTLNCQVCLAEIPASEAASSEATDYVAAVCGLECYVQWQAQTGALVPEPPPAGEAAAEA